MHVSRLAMSCAWRQGICLALLVGEALSQFHTFSDELVSGRTLSRVNGFYVMSGEDLPDTIDDSFAKFIGFTAEISGASTPVQASPTVQVALIRSRLFDELINVSTCCSHDSMSNTAQHLVVAKKNDQTLPEAGAYVYSVRAGFRNTPSEIIQKDEEMNILATGEYTLLVSNCNAFDVKLSGIVIVKSGYGFLPANEYVKMKLYGWLLVIYLLSSIVWIALSVRWRTELFQIQFCIGTMVFIAMLQSCMWFVALQSWNRHGVRGKVVFSVAIFLSVAKSIFSYMLLLVASLGWGVTQPYLDSRIVRKLKMYVVAYTCFDFLRQSLAAWCTNVGFLQTVNFILQVPIVIINASIFVWVYTSLTGLMSTLKDRGQTDKLLLFQRLWNVLRISWVIAVLIVLYELTEVTSLGGVGWRERWFYSDGAREMLFCCILCVIMILWAPNKNSIVYAYSRNVDTTESAAVSGDRPNEPWADDHDMDDGEDEESFWAATRKDEPRSAPIGAVTVDALTLDDKVTVD